MSKKTHWKKMTDPNYLGHWDLDGDLTVQIDRVERRELMGSNGKSDSVMVVVLKDQKPMVLNKTNARTLERIFRSGFVEDWSGRSFTVYRTRVKSFNEMVDALRIRTKLPN